MSFRIESQLSEDQIETDVASYLGFITPFWSKRFRLVSVDEQITGADKLFDRFVPIYLQFKVSHGLNPNGSVLQRYFNKPLPSIIKYRKNNNLSGNPILYFQLREQAKTAFDLQHNILFKLNTPPSQFGLYIAPLTLSLSDYENQLSADWHFKYYREHPMFHREINLHDTDIHRHVTFRSIPFLRHHISIPPHKLTTSHKHYYSFSPSGGDVAWHGGETLKGDFRLSYQYSRILNFAYYNREFAFTQIKYSNFIREFDAVNIGRSSNNNFYYDIVGFSSMLKNTFGIKLFLLCDIQD